MKTKTFNKKLFLKKETIAHLKAEEMSQVPGGFGISKECQVTIPVTCPCPLTEWETCWCSDIRCN